MKKAHYEHLKNIERESGIYTIKRDSFSIYEKIRVYVNNYYLQDEVHIKSGYWFDTLPQKNRIEIDNSINTLFVGDFRFGDEPLFKEYYCQGGLKISLFNSDTLLSTEDFKINHIEEEFLNFSVEEYEIISKFEKLYHEYYQKKICLYPLLKKALKEFFSEVEAYTLLFRKCSLKRIYLTRGYKNKTLMYVARKHKVETIEIQYANLSDFHAGFSSWYSEVILPDRLIVWDKSQKKKLLEYAGTIEIKKPEIYTSKLKFNQKENRLLIIIQDFYLNEFAELSNIEYPKDIEVVFVFKKRILIPMSLYFKLYTKKIKFKKIEREELLKYLAESKWVLSGASTTLIEAHYLNCVPILYTPISSSYEFLEYSEQGIFYPANDGEGIVSVIEDFKQPDINENTLGIN